MDNKKELENGRKIGSVKAAIDKYGGKVNQGTSPVKKLLQGTSESEVTYTDERPSKAQELHLAKKRMSQFGEDMKMAKSVKSEAELELLQAKKTVKELTLQIQESKSKAKKQMKELQTLSKVTEERQISVSKEVKDSKYAQVGKEVEVVKRELSKIRLDMARILEEKSRAEKEAEAASLRFGSCMSTAQQLRKDIEEANEEEVLVELAQIQARKELLAVEAQRKEEAKQMQSLIDETRKKISILTEEAEQTKDIENQLAEMNSDVEVLQNELKLIKEMDRRVDSNVKSKKSDLQLVAEDLEAAKKELASVTAQEFELMTSMDGVRIELRNILQEKDQLEKQEGETEKSMQILNSKLLRAKDKLEVVSTSEEKAQYMLSSLSLALEKLETEMGEAKKERERSTEETASIRNEIKKTESQTDATEERLQLAMQELVAVKSAEAKALKKLKTLAEDAVKTRASKKKSTITISRFEYAYLTGCASGAQELADKKVAAAHAWAEALRVSEREMKIKIALAEKEIKELMLKEEQEIHILEKLLNTEELPMGDLQYRGQGTKSIEQRKSMRENRYKLTPVRQSKLRRSSGSSATRPVTNATSFTMKRRRKVMLKIAKYFASKQNENNSSGSIE